MAKDITVKVTGQNPDGTFTIQTDAGNPFGGMAPTNTGIVPYGQMAPPQTAGYRATINGVSVVFASEAEALKADRAVRDMMESQSAPSLGGMRVGGLGTATSAGSNWLRTGAHAAEAVAGFLNGRNIRRKLGDFDEALSDGRVAREELDNLERAGKYSDLIPVLRRALLAERDATESSLSVLEDQLTAVDIQTGSGVAKVASDLLGDGGGSAVRGQEGGLGSALAVGAGGLGLGLLMSRDRDERRPRRR